MALLTTSGTGMAIGVVWCVIGILLIVIARKVRRRKRLHQMIYGFSLAGFFMGASYVFDNIGSAYVGTNLILICAILLLIDISRKNAP